MTLKLNGTNSVAAPAYAGDDADTGLQCGTDELKLVTGGTARATVDSSGQLGIGTTSPGQLLHLSSASPRIRLTHTAANSNAFVDAATSGVLEFSADDNNAASNSSVRFKVDGTEHMRLTDDGYLKVSTNGTFSANGTNNFYQSSTSDFGLLVGGYGAYASTVLVLEGTNATGASFNLLQGYRAGNATTGAGGTLSINIAGSGNVTNSFNSYGAISDIKLKENIVDASSQWDDIKAFQVRNYNFKEETGQETQTQIGVIAQEIETVSPGLVYETADRDREGNDLGTVTKSVNYSVLYMKAVKALQEAQTRIETLETQNTAQQTQIDDLLARVTALEVAE